MTDEWHVEKHRIGETQFWAFRIKEGQRIVADMLNEEDVREIVSAHNDRISLRKLS